jgi:hypothetical protein
MEQIRCRTVVGNYRILQWIMRMSIWFNVSYHDSALWPIAPNLPRELEMNSAIPQFIMKHAIQIASPN